MNDEQALKIVSALANGLDPVRNEPVDLPSVLQELDVIRALYVAARALESTSRSRARANRGRMPAKAGKPWTEEEDRQLLERFDAGQTVAQLAQAHERTLAGIQARLERHGRVQGQGLQWRGRAGNAVAGSNDGERSET
ncbi:MAG: hypothetical protein SXG53_04125 [Pseudomonadota bacterium]|nr:hypothetical protein [Pseudomonadota bacterium]